MACGLPWEGEDRATPHLTDVAEDVPTCRPTDTVDHARSLMRARNRAICAVVDDAGIILGSMRMARILEELGRKRVDTLMDPAPPTYRPSATADEVQKWMDEERRDWAFLTTSDGVLLGAVAHEALARR